MEQRPLDCLLEGGESQGLTFKETKIGKNRGRGFSGKTVNLNLDLGFQWDIDVMAFSFFFSFLSLFLPPILHLLCQALLETFLGSFRKFFLMQSLFLLLFTLAILPLGVHFPFMTGSQGRDTSHHLCFGECRAVEVCTLLENHKELDFCWMGNLSVCLTCGLGAVDLLAGSSVGQMETITCPSC